MRTPPTDRSVVNIQTEAKGEKNGKYEEVKDIEHSEKALNMYNWSPKGEKRENRAKAIFEEMTKNFPKKYQKTPSHIFKKF